MTQAKKDSSQTRLGSSRLTLTGESARNTHSAVKRLLLYARPFSAQLIIVAALVIISTFASLAGPILFGMAIDQFINTGDLPGLARIALIMLGVFLLGGLASIIHGIIMVGVGQRLIADVRAELFMHLQALSMAYHDQHKVGDLMSRVTNDSEAINQVISNGLITFITNILMLHHQYSHAGRHHGFDVPAQLAACHRNADFAAIDGLFHHPGDAPQPGGFPGCAAQFGDDECCHGRKYRRNPSGQSLCPG